MYHDVAVTSLPRLRPIVTLTSLTGDTGVPATENITVFIQRYQDIIMIFRMHMKPKNWITQSISWCISCGRAVSCPPYDTTHKGFPRQISMQAAFPCHVPRSRKWQTLHIVRYREQNKILNKQSLLVFLLQLLSTPVSLCQVNIHTLFWTQLTY